MNNTAKSIIVEPFEERLDGATDSLYAYAIGPRLFCLKHTRLCYEGNIGSSSAPSHITGGQSACPSGRSVLAGGSGSTAAYASHDALRDAGVLLCFFGQFDLVCFAEREIKM